MTKLRQRSTLFSAIIVATALGLIGCSAPTVSDGAADDPSVAPTEESTAGDDALGCPAEMDAIVGAGGDVEVERVAPADYFLPGLDDALLADACIYENETQGKSAQWGFFRGDDAAAVATAITEALAAAGYTLDDEFDGAQLYTSTSNPSLTVFAVATAEEAAAKDSEQLFELIGPWVSVFQYYS